jgi:outer membrane lipoprotein-sorting protein
MSKSGIPLRPSKGSTSEAVIRTDATGGVLFNRNAVYRLDAVGVISVAELGHSVNERTVMLILNGDCSLDLGGYDVVVEGDKESVNANVYTFDTTKTNVVILFWDGEKIARASSQKSALSVAYSSVAAISFNGIDEYIEVASNSLYAINPLHERTISFWVESGGAANQAIVGQFGNNSGAVPLGWMVRQKSGGGIEIKVLNNSGREIRVETNTALPSGKTHVVVVYDQKTVTIYFDSVSQATTVHRSDLLDGDLTYDALLNFRMGAHNEGHYADITLDEVSLFSEAATQTQVNTLYNSGTPLNPDDFELALIEHFDMNTITPVGVNGAVSTQTGLDGSNIVNGF